MPGWLGQVFQELRFAQFLKKPGWLTNLFQIQQWHDERYYWKISHAAARREKFLKHLSVNQEKA